MARLAFANPTMTSINSDFLHLANSAFNRSVVAFVLGIGIVFFLRCGLAVSPK
jgi:hypothetical protein